MLNYFRHHSLRKSLWLVILLASLFMQTQSLFACELMGSAFQPECCCDNEITKNCPAEGSCYSLGNALIDCCEASAKIDVGLQGAVVSDTHYNKQILSLDVAQQPPAIVLEYQALLSIENHSNKLVLNVFTPSISSLGTSTYFKTLRFRI